MGILLTYVTEKLDISHSIFEFQSGDPEVDSYFDRAYEEVASGNSIVYVMLNLARKHLIGFFAICMTSVRTEFDKGKEMRWPAALIGQLGVDKKFQKRGYGAKLVKEALYTIYLASKEIGCRAVVVETYNKALIESFYSKLGFRYVRQNKIKNRIRYTLVYDLSKYEAR